LVEGPIIGQEEAFRKIGRSHVNVQIIWVLRFSYVRTWTNDVQGTKDTVVEPRYADVLKKLMPQAKKHIIEGVGHDLTLTVPDKVAAVIMDFLGPSNGK